MPYEAKILKDSLAPSGARLTTFECTYPRMVHAEIMTHREFSRNAASSRAIPVKKLIDRVDKDPVIPVWWGKNQRGMQADEEMGEKEKKIAVKEWLSAKEQAVEHARYLADLGAHKQIVNRLLETWTYITVIITSNSYENFFHLRNTWVPGTPPGPAQPEVATIARMMHEVYNKSTPNLLKSGEWHLPLVELVDLSDPLFIDSKIGWESLVRISAARCARVSYLTHFGTRDLEADIDLCESLISNGHWSPLEHVARAEPYDKCSGNIRGYTQFRKLFSNEYFNK